MFLLSFVADVQCFGRDCYPAVFAVNTVLIIVAFCKWSSSTAPPEDIIFYRCFCPSQWYLFDATNLHTILFTSFLFSFLPLLTHSLTHSLIYLLNHSLTYSRPYVVPTYLFSQSVGQTVSQSVSHYLRTNSLTCSINYVRRLSPVCFVIIIVVVVIVVVVVVVVSIYFWFRTHASDALICF